MAPTDPCPPGAEPPQSKPKTPFEISSGEKKQGQLELHGNNTGTYIGSTSAPPGSRTLNGESVGQSDLGLCETIITSAKRKSTSASNARDMAEPPSKRTKRTDSAALWDKTDGSGRDHDRDSREPDRKPIDRERHGDHGRRASGRDERRYRSRSREIAERRRDRSRSRERTNHRGRHGRRERDRSRSRSRDRDRNGVRRGRYTQSILSNDILMGT